ncbi:MAG: cell division protein FtsL [Deltaproteobacteria bacterium]|nr:cell division protein FtsL [Deltaproteobacteria bacterium]
MKDQKIHRGPPPPRPTQSLVVLVAVFLGVLSALGAVLFVWERFEYLQLGYEVSALRQQERRMLEDLLPLEVEAQYLSRPERVESLARERYGMGLPAPGQVKVWKQVPLESAPPELRSQQQGAQP